MRNFSLNLKWFMLLCTFMGKKAIMLTSAIWVWFHTVH